MKKILVVFIICAFFIGCIEPSNTEIGTLQKLKNKGVKSLILGNFTSSINQSILSSRSALSVNDIKTLINLDETGKSEPLIFNTSTKKEVVLEVTDMIKIDNRRIVVNFTDIHEVAERGGNLLITRTENYSGKTLIDMDTGVLYDITGYSDNFLSSEDTLFGIKQNTLFKIDLKNISSAVPLNNPQFHPVGNNPYADNNIVKINNKILCNDFSFDINNLLPPKQVKPYIDEELELPIDAWLLSIYHFTDINNDIWYYMFKAHRDQSGKAMFSSFYTCKINIDDDGQLGISDYSEYTLLNFYDGTRITNKDNNTVFIGYQFSGIAMVEKDPSGVGITVRENPKRFPDVYKGVVYNNFLYWREESSIKRISLDNDDPEETVYTFDSNSSRILTQKPIILNGQLVFIFYEYFDATTVGTYFLPLDNLEESQRLVSTSVMNIENIIELRF